MSRENNPQILRDELCQMFHQGLDEGVAYERLKKDPRFSTIRLSKVKAEHKHLKTEADGANRPKRAKLTISLRSDQPDPGIIEFLDRSENFLYFKNVMECNHIGNECLGFTNGVSPDARYFFLLNLRTSTNELYGFHLFDTVYNKITQVTISKHPENGIGIFYLFFISERLGILVEQLKQGNRIRPVKYFLSLVEFDVNSTELKKLETHEIERPQFMSNLPDFYVDPLATNRFVIERQRNESYTNLMYAEVIDEKIVFDEEKTTASKWAQEGSYAISDGKFFGFQPVYNTQNTNLSEASITVSSPNGRSQGTSYRLKPLPKGLRAVFGEHALVGCWASSRFFVAVETKATNIFGIAWTACETREWTLMEFSTTKQIVEMQFISTTSHLLVQTLDQNSDLRRKSHQIRKTLYRIPLGIPESLTHLAWFSLLRSTSKMVDVDPYEEASRFLPFTSDIRDSLD